MESAFRDGAFEPGLRLIETLGARGGQLVRLERHLARLEASAGRLGFVFDGAAAEAALRGALSGSDQRLRLTLARDGSVAVTAGALAANPAEWRVAVSEVRLRAEDPWLGVKTTKRRLYDETRAGLVAGLDEVIFANARGEVCEGTISNIFFDRGDGLMTPPLSCGLLPGVLRAEMLDSGACAEGVLRLEDLGQVRRWLGNSLRGLIPASIGMASP
ncbi:aminotransferase class IV family protein [Neogemmobacter tilapiae]|uniref:Probable branched-chain-amino-acid aminotransferase n=1 Tax=Neogemmobacter tilapiae TaxID=875041 RepID=A0A918TYS2_9RHOB|nr:aminotransferase class IV family protein [Gemmobacter tilapiae]GHC64986.1 aminotransferase class IV [Gemmobacter tilapiae]